MTEELNTDKVKSSLLSPDHWLRLIYMLLFALMLHVASIAMWVLCAMQFLFTLFTDKDNENLRSLGKSITLFIKQALDFLSYNTEIKPFPFADWPCDDGPVTADKSLAASGESEQPEEPAQPEESGQPEVSEQTEESDHSEEPKQSGHPAE